MASITQDLRFKQAVIEYSLAHGVTKAAIRYRKTNGFIRNLSASEIVQQVILMKDKINRIVFMGMGEPLLNYDTLIKAIHILRDRNGLDFPTDGITISTVGPLKESAHRLYGVSRGESVQTTLSGYIRQKRVRL